MDGAIDGATEGAAGPVELAGAPGPVQAAASTTTTANIRGRALARRSWFMSRDTSCLGLVVLGFSAQGDMIRAWRIAPGTSCSMRVTAAVWSDSGTGLSTARPPRRSIRGGTPEPGSRRT